MKLFDASVKKYIDIFSGQESYFVNDVRTLELFRNSPLNVKAEDIKTKLSALSDNAEIQQLTQLDDMVKHILELKIDERLRKGDLTVVEDVAHMASEGKSYNLLNFASTYCNFHRPDLFPIYTDQHFDFYSEYVKEHKLTFNPDKPDSYKEFAGALDDLAKRYGLKGKMNYLQLRKFGWLYFDYILKESQEQPMPVNK